MLGKHFNFSAIFPAPRTILIYFTIFLFNVESSPFFPPQILKAALQVLQKLVGP